VVDQRVSSAGYVSGTAVHVVRGTVKRNRGVRSVRSSVVHRLPSVNTVTERFFAESFRRVSINISATQKKRNTRRRLFGVGTRAPPSGRPIATGSIIIIIVIVVTTAETNGTLCAARITDRSAIN